MADVRNCPICGKIFVKMSRNMCPDCADKEEEEFILVRDYLKDNPGASVEDIAEATEVEERKVLKWMREGRIEYTFQDSGEELTCDTCGTEITVGNICTRCRAKLANQLNSISKSPAPFNPEVQDNKGQSSQSSQPGQKGRDSKGMAVVKRFRHGDK